MHKIHILSLFFLEILNIIRVIVNNIGYVMDKMKIFSSALI